MPLQSLVVRHQNIENILFQAQMGEMTQHQIQVPPQQFFINIQVIQPIL